MRIEVRTFSLPKAGREFVDYEDAYFPANPADWSEYFEERGNVDQFRAAVSDGASDSCFSQFWAQLLCRGFGDGEWNENVSAASLNAAQGVWGELLKSQELPWYAQEKAKDGAFAAFAGLSIESNGRRWNAIAIGDCCIFHIREHSVLSAMPIEKSKEFDNFPLLVGSLPERNAGVFETKKVKTDGTWQHRDIFYLMSDSLACWFLYRLENVEPEQVIAWLNNVQDHQTFEQFVQSERSIIGPTGLANMRDDDVTFMRILAQERESSIGSSSRGSTAELRVGSDATKRDTAPTGPDLNVANSSRAVPSPPSGANVPPATRAETATSNAATSTAARDAATRNAARDSGTRNAERDAATGNAARDAATGNAARDSVTSNAARNSGTSKAATDSVTGQGASDSMTSKPASRSAESKSLPASGSVDVNLQQQSSNNDPAAGQPRSYTPSAAPNSNKMVLIVVGLCVVVALAVASASMSGSNSAKPHPTALQPNAVPVNNGSPNQLDGAPTNTNSPTAHTPRSLEPIAVEHPAAGRDWHANKQTPHARIPSHDLPRPAPQRPRTSKAANDPIELLPHIKQQDDANVDKLRSD